MKSVIFFGQTKNGVFFPKILLISQLLAAIKTEIKLWKSTGFVYSVSLFANSLFTNLFSARYVEMRALEPWNIPGTVPIALELNSWFTVILSIVSAHNHVVHF